MTRGLKITGSSLLMLLAIAILIVCKYDFPKKINLTYPAIEFRPGNQASVDKTAITLKGTLHRKLFRDQRFTGEIEITKYEVTKARMMPIVFNKNINNGWGVTVYLNDTYDADSGAVQEMNIVQLSSIWKTGDFDSMKFLLFEPVGADSGQGKDLQIMAPATDYDSAMALDQQYKEQGKY
ncbi:hypothetical protein [Paenibacillus glycanilyticus]|uniref:Lipoprotein n=1 Tax=Paenibacillus glycanilyticus TaxID=126569 RepID=A0ABQ6GCT6_9BACL|nr:hypothetical protein [Paenibacillus glycanilyticus]GLX68749.1 hypothetical protein MU1_30940 [Paenibacillus glycanilyticus]